MAPIRTPILPTVRPRAAWSRYRHLTDIVIPVPWNIGKSPRRSRTIGASGRPTRLLTFALNLSDHRLRHLVAHTRR
jgi:hypothetical protein